ncbi:MAG TPA: carboxypeptidase-like regulatory domain-containing protein [Thermoanaerobaculia bacterium]
MRRFRAIALFAVVVVAAVPARPDTPLPSALQVLGTVTNAARPVADALVIALNLQDLKTTQTWTTNDGRFVLPALRSGVYKIIAVKQGFAPVITTVVPTGTDHRISLRLDSERDGRKKSVNQEIWELRGSLPADVLRSLDFALLPLEFASYELPRFRGEMISLTGVAEQASPAYAQTALGVQGRFGESWQVDIRGDLQRFEDPTDTVSFGSPIAESSVMSMEVSSSPENSYRVDSTRSSWVYADPHDGATGGDVSSHNFRWQRGPARVEVRYFEQDNLFSDQPMGSRSIEIGGNMPLLQTRRNDFGVSLRVTQESVESVEDIFRTMDLAANGTFAMVPSLILHYGLASRLALDGEEVAPRSGAEWKITKNTSLIGSVLYKVIDREPDAVLMPAIVFWSDDARVLPRYAYTFGFVTGNESNARFSAVATVTAVDDPLRVVFADMQSQFWDGLRIDAGDVRRDVRIAYRREFGKRFTLDVGTTAGTASSADRHGGERDKVYISGDLQSTFTPTGTTLAVSYRDVQQPHEMIEDDYRTERVHVRMAQSLYLPIDVKLLLGLELARSENSPYLLDTLTPEGRSKKFIGGLAVNF